MRPRPSTVNTPLSATSATTGMYLRGVDVLLHPELPMPVRSTKRAGAETVRCILIDPFRRYGREAWPAWCNIAGLRVAVDSSKMSALL